MHYEPEGEMDDRAYMQLALAQAQLAFDLGEVPIGAVMVRNGEIIARGHNLRNTDKNPLRHAEIDVIDVANRAMLAFAARPSPKN